MKLSYTPFTIHLKDVFTLASSSRTTTPVVLVTIESDGITAYGEASLPPYLGATQQSVIAFLQQLDLQQFSCANSLDEILCYVNGVVPGNTAAKAAVDIALHDLYGKKWGKAWWQMWSLDRLKAPYTSFTIGIDTPEEIRRKTLEAKGYKILKVKLGGNTDRMIIETIRSVTNVPICVDVNQGWTDKHYALEMLHWCHEQGVVFAEQPMPVSCVDQMAWLTQHSPIPTIADESFQLLSDLENVHGVFSGVNIKLMKCTGLHEARLIIEKARCLEMKVMLGCMTETSCAIGAASQLAPLVDWADLDGNLLITNDCFRGAQLTDGRVIPSALPGIGVEKL